MDKRLNFIVLSMKKTLPRFPGEVLFLDILV